MQNSTLFYGEMVAKISAHLNQNSAHRNRINYVLEQNTRDSDTIWSFCSDAARVFDSLEDLSWGMAVDWHKALDEYSEKVLSHILSGQKPDFIDMLSMASLSLENAR